MKRLSKLTAAVVAAAPLLAGLAAHAAPATPASPNAPPADVVGSWDIRITFPGRPAQETTLKIEKAGDKYVGVMTNNQGRANPVKDVQYKDGELSWKVTFERQGQAININYSAKVTGETLKGKANFKVPGRELALNLEGNRAKPPSPAAGLWKITFILDSGQKLQSSIQVKQSGDKLGGEYVGISGKKARAKEVTFKDGALSFDAPDQAENQELVFHYEGKVKDDTLKGTVSWTGDGNKKQSLKFEAEKSKTLTADVTGTWKLKVAVKNGPTFEPTLKLTQNGGAVSGTYTGEQGDTPIADGLVLGDEFTFEVTRVRDGKSYKLRYQSKVAGDTLKGNVDYNFDGMSGYFDFEGKRVAPAGGTK